MKKLALLVLIFVVSLASVALADVNYFLRVLDTTIETWPSYHSNSPTEIEDLLVKYAGKDLIGVSVTATPICYTKGKMSGSLGNPKKITKINYKGYTIYTWKGADYNDKKKVNEILMRISISAKGWMPNGTDIGNPGYGANPTKNLGLILSLPPIGGWPNQ